MRSELPYPVDVTLCAALAQGGIAHYTYALATALQAAGLRTTVLMYGHPEYDLADFPHTHRIVRDLELATSRATAITSPFRNLLAMLRTTRKSRVVHFQWSLGGRTDRLHWPILSRLGKRIVYTAHDVIPHEPEIMSLDHARWIYHRADAVIVHGERLRELLLQRFSVDPQAVHVIPQGNYNFLADTPNRWTRESARASFGWDDDDRVVLFFGLIREYKGLDVLLEACRIVRDRGLGDGRRLRLLVAGRTFKNHWAEGEYDELIRRLGLSEQIRLELGHIAMSDIPRVFRAADVVAVPYKRGSHSAVLHLAYSFGKATVATRVGSLAEVPSEDIARFVEPEDHGALADALHALLLDPSASSRLGEAARHHADTDLGWDRIAAKTKAVYASLR